MDLATEERLKPLERGLEALVEFAILGPLQVLDQRRRTHDDRRAGPVLAHLGGRQLAAGGDIQRGGCGWR